MPGDVALVNYVVVLMKVDNSAQAGNGVSDNSDNIDKLCCLNDEENNVVFTES